MRVGRLRINNFRGFEQLELRRESNPRPILPHHLTPVPEGGEGPIRNPQQLPQVPWSGRPDLNRRPSAPKAEAAIRKPLQFQ